MRFSIPMLTFLLLFSACRDDAAYDLNIDPAVDIPEGAMLIERDSQLIISEFNNVLIGISSGSEDGRIFSIRTTIDEAPFLLNIVNWNWQQPPFNGILPKRYDANTQGNTGSNTSCQAVGSSLLCDSASGSYEIDSVSYFTQSFDGASAGTITITEVNGGQQTISGAFEITMQAEGRPDRLTFSGGFNRIPYFVL